MSTRVNYDLENQKVSCIHTNINVDLMMFLVPVQNYLFKTNSKKINTMHFFFFLNRKEYVYYDWNM